MKVTTHTPEVLVVRFARWKGPLYFAAISLLGLAAAALLVADTLVPLWVILVLLLVTVAWSLPMALFRVEKSMLVLNAATATAELRHRDIRGLHVHHWPLGEVQSTRVTLPYRMGGRRTADKEPSRDITLLVREGMDEGRHALTKYPVTAQDALAVSGDVSKWMKAWRASVDSGDVKP